MSTLDQSSTVTREALEQRRTEDRGVGRLEAARGDGSGISDLTRSKPGRGPDDPDESPQRTSPETVQNLPPVFQLDM
jgi:hypothetical protein